MRLNKFPRKFKEKTNATLSFCLNKKRSERTTFPLEALTFDLSCTHNLCISFAVAFLIMIINVIIIDNDLIAAVVGGGDDGYSEDDKKAAPVVLA